MLLVFDGVQYINKQASSAFIANAFTFMAFVRCPYPKWRTKVFEVSINKYVNMYSLI